MACERPTPSTRMKIPSAPVLAYAGMILAFGAVMIAITGAWTVK